MDHSPSREFNSLSAAQETTCFYGTRSFITVFRGVGEFRVTL